MAAKLVALLVGELLGSEPAHLRRVGLVTALLVDAGEVEIGVRIAGVLSARARRGGLEEDDVAAEGCQ